MAIKSIFKPLIVFVWLLNPLLATAQEEKLKAIGIGGLILISEPRDSFLKGSFEWKFSRHWSVQPEVYTFTDYDMLPFFAVFVSYYFDFGKKYDLFPYLSIGGGGWIYGDEGDGAILIYGIRVGVRKILVKNLDKAWALNLGVLFPHGIWLSIGLELCIF